MVDSMTRDVWDYLIDPAAALAEVACPRCWADVNPEWDRCPECGYIATIDPD